MFLHSAGISFDNYTTVNRDAITLPDTGLVIYNLNNTRLEVNVGTPAVPNWQPVSGTGGGGGGTASSMIAVFNDVVQSSSLTYERVAAFPFPGTSEMSISKINALIRRNGAATSVSMRIYDVTNAQVIAEVTGVTTLDETLITDLGTISNLPAGEATFEVQLLRVGGTGGARAFCSGIEFRG
jgi:hypothetical protein